MKILAVSDLHCDTAAADALVSAAGAADLVIAAGDFANAHQGLDAYMARLSPIADRMICVPGNNETEAALRKATNATVLHGETCEWNGLRIAGLGGGIPPLPSLPWKSWDLAEAEAQARLDRIDGADILITHSPPIGLGDNHTTLGHIGSTAIKAPCCAYARSLPSSAISTTAGVKAACWATRIGATLARSRAGSRSSPWQRASRPTSLISTEGEPP